MGSIDHRAEPSPTEALAALVKSGKVGRRELLKRAMALGFTATGASALISAHDRKAAALRPRSSGGGVVRVAVSSYQESDNLDPGRQPNRFSGIMTTMLYDTLVRYEEVTWEVRPALAESWEVSPDNMTWTFELREGVEWHNGEPLRAQDVAWSFQRILDESIGASLMARFASVVETSGIEVLDEQTLRLNLHSPDPFLPLVLGQRDARIIREGQGTTAGEVDGIGTGPFRLLNFTPGESAETERNPDYWDGSPSVDGVEVIVIPDEATKLESVISGDSHYMDPIPLSLLPVAQAAGDQVRVDFGENVRMMNVTLQADVEPFTDNRVRDAFKYAIDRDRLIEVAALGRGTWTADIPVVNDDPYFPPSLADRAQDLDLARSLLAEAGFSSGMDLVLHTTDLNGQSDFALVFAEMMAEVDVRIQIERHEAGQYNADVWLKEPFYTQGAWSRRHPNEILALTLMQGGDFNEPRWDDPALTELVGEARRAANQEEQIQLFHEALELVANNSGWIIPYFYDTPYVSKPELEGVGLDAVSGPNFHTAVLQ